MTPPPHVTGPMSTSSPSWRLRPAVVEDAMALGVLELELFPDEAWTPFQLAEEIEHPHRRYVVVEAVDGPDDGEVLGYAGLMLAGETADIHTIGTVRPRQGIGRALLAWLEEQARASGAERMLLEVREDNVRARAFYDRAGYQQIGRRPGYYRLRDGAVDAILMQREVREHRA